MLPIDCNTEFNIRQRTEQSRDRKAWGQSNEDITVKYITKLAVSI